MIAPTADHLTVTAVHHHLHFIERPLIMGVLNVTPDSFSDGGLYESQNAAVARARRMVEEGADLIDIGAESSRPGSEPISETEELKRLIPIVEAVHEAVQVPLSVDTTKAAVARRAIEAGAVVVNDISALTFDPDMGRVVSETEAAIVLMHMQGVPRTMQRDPQYGNVVHDVLEFLDARIQAAIASGISRKQIILDPGIGFGKLLEHNLALLARLKIFTSLNRPLLVGVSRKGFIGQMLRRSVQERLFGTAAAVALSVQQGASILRVHDVAAMHDVVRTATAIMRYSEQGQQVPHA